MRFKAALERWVVLWICVRTITDQEVLMGTIENRMLRLYSGTFVFGVRYMCHTEVLALLLP